ncbi:hypothetical protein G6F47_012891 [Rhizopus delemar]|nr:hypothetical protein G6F54_012715 [Rhizopus delemar]KAG1493403.1 hypothetical protein G6F53_012762 [Rhizopus delemar]KAG1532746.1 hypothetical protein G6F51_012960 [Rhizopus arrhizus]KAG1578514.1 hypothetical protein G6F47_012891 [Rhizopus delemar]KAG1613767.1 hypothetical protein G6F45_012746 [Rhizopus arrhizus]
MDSFRTPKDYLSKTPPRLWCIDSVLKDYCTKHPGLYSSDLLKKIETDMDEIATSRPQQSSAITKLKSTLKSFHIVLDNETKNSSMATNKVAYKWHSHGSVTFNQTSVAEDSNKRKQLDVNHDQLTVKKGKKHYNFTPQMKPSTSTHKPRISDEDQTLLSPLYAIKINDMHSIDTPKKLIDKFEKNKNNQAGILSLKKRSIVHQFLKSALDQPLNGLRQFLWTHGYKNGCSEEEKLDMELVRLILTDFTATCEKPAYPAVTNERTPFVESIVPLFKYLSAIMGSIAFVWCEKGLSVCAPEATKLLDGIGMTTMDHIHRILIESSG